MTNRRSILLPILLAMLVLAASMFSVMVSASEVSILNSTLIITDNQNTLTASGNSITATVTSSVTTHKTNTLTIKNNTAEENELSFDYSVSNLDTESDDAFKINGSNYGGDSSASGTYKVRLAAGASISIAFRARRGLGSRTATLTLSNISLEAVASASNITFVFDSALGEMTAGGEKINSGDVLENVSSTNGISMEATSNNGTSFLGWINTENGQILSNANSYTLIPSKDMTVMPVFVKEDGTPWFGVGAAGQHTFQYGVMHLSTGQYKTVEVSYLFDDLNKAADFANSNAANKYMVLMNSGTLSAGNYSIPAGVTLLIPFDDQRTLFETHPMSADTYTVPTAYRTLTMASGANLEINGAVSISAKHKIIIASERNGSSPTLSYGLIKMDSGSNINVNSGGKLYVWGYITGIKGSQNGIPTVREGTVNVKDGGTVYEYFQVSDYRGGTQTTSMENRVFPFSQYYIQTVEVPLTLNYGAREICALTLLIDIKLDTYNMFSAVDFIGPSSSMFNLTRGSIVKDYDEDTDRLNLTINGDMTLSPITLDLGQAKIDTNAYVMAVNPNFSVRVLNNGSFTIHEDQDLALLPSVEVYIDEGASALINSNVYVYDIDQWGGYCSPYNGTHYILPYAPGRIGSRSALDDASICVDGTLSITGTIYTTQSGANIYSTENGGQVIMNAVGTATTTYQLVQSSGYTEIPITPAKLKNGDGSYAQTANCTTASASNPLVMTYTDGKWLCEKHTDDPCKVCEYTEGGVCKHTDTETIPAVEATCTATGLTEGQKCSACGEVLTAQEEVAATGHAEVVDAAVAATCTTAGKTEGKHCSKCNEVLVAQEEITALGHTEETLAGKAATCNDAGLTEGKKCTVCGEITVKQEEISALGHKEETVAGTAATCLATGLTDGKKCKVCGEVTVKQEEIAALGHKEETVAGKAATCTETGLTEGKKCTVCGVTTTAQEVIPAAGHSYNDEWEVITEATESQAGEKRRDCQRENCDDYETAVIPALAHNCASWPEVTLEEKAPTCTETGLTAGSKCSKCDAPIVAQEVIPALGHTTETLTGKAATCTETGLTEGKKCTVCGETTVAQEEIKALGHTEQTVAGKAATCTETGLTDGKKCTVCSETTVAQEEIKALGHTEETIPGKAATCLATGLTDGEKCSVCGEILTAQETIPATGHTEETVEGKDATCTETGLTDGVKCSVCGQTITAQETISAKGHTKETVKGKNATCTETGLTAGEKCSVCGEITVAQEEIPAKGHTEVIDAAEAATCTETGKTEGKHCSVCGVVLVAQEEIQALGHTEVVDAAEDATCTQPGKTEGKHCSVCNAVTVAQEVIPNPGHNHEAVVTEPTCTDGGYTTYTCSACGDTYTADQKSATGHAYNDGEVTTEPNGCTDGVMTFTCGNCGDSYTEPIDAPHFPFEGACSQCGVELCSHECEQDEIPAKDATCTEAGATAGEQCSNCGKVTKKPEVIPPTGHSYSSEITEDVTCTQNGVRTFTCENCDDSYTEGIPTPGHTIVTDAAVEPTCSSVGLTQGSHCDVCEEVFVAQGIVPKLKHTDKEPSPDHICDVCEITIGIHKAYSGTHDCAYCGKPASECADSDGDMACDVCGKDVSVAITFVDYFGSTTKYFGVGESIAFPKPLTESYSFELEFLGWTDASGNLVTEETVVATATTTYTATYKVTGFKTESIQLSVEYGAKNTTDEANGIIMYATLFVYVDANSSLGEPIIKFVEIDPETGEVKKESLIEDIFDFTDPQGRQTIYMYRLAFTAEDIADNNTFISIGVGDYAFSINKVLFKYAESLSGIIESGENTEAVMAAQQKLIDGMIRYGGAVQDCFEKDHTDVDKYGMLAATSKILESFDKLGDERKERDAADSIITTHFAAATGVFDTKISLQYYYNVTLNVQNAENVRIGVIVADTEEELTKLSGDFESATKSTAMFYTSEIKQVKDEQGQEKQYYVSTTEGMTINEMEDKFAVIYVKYTVGNVTHHYYGDIIPYGIERFAQRQVVDYSSADIGGKGKTVSSDEYTNEQYVNMMLRILEAYKASEALEELRAPKN